ncbi:MAG: LysR family transcriptional regulator [Lachnospiraceae bacterium]|nr:LysR family transcriptional regulator [Lachnospiraceae bacterium]
MLDFRIDTFLAVCQYQSYTKAAQALNITQPGVSQHIHFLENYYGIQLFTYQNRKLTLTQEGELFRTAVTTMKIDEQHLRERFAASPEGVRKLFIGFTLTIGEYGVLPRLVAYFQNQPQLSAEICIHNTCQLLQKLDAGELDAAIVEGYFDKTQYDYRSYSSEPYIAVCSGKRRLPANTCLSFEDLFKERLICRENGSGTLEILEKCLQERNFSLLNFEKTIRVTNINVIKELVAQDCGITFLYRTAVQQELENGMLQQIPIRDFQVTHDFTFIWRKNSLFKNEYEKLFTILSGS